MAGLVPAIHVDDAGDIREFARMVEPPGESQSAERDGSAWMTGTSPVMTPRQERHDGEGGGIDIHPRPRNKARVST